MGLRSEILSHLSESFDVPAGCDGAEVRDALLNSRQYWIISGQLANHVSND